MQRGRPTQSQIRQNMVDMLSYLGKGYGYHIAKTYNEIFPHVTQRVIYYHLKKGISLGEFKVEKVQKKKGSYSWGEEVTQIFYSLGEKAKPIERKDVKEQLHKLVPG